ncbi:MAG: flagellar biosynthesis protein FlgN [Treponema sp.]|jgi:hypothetical protein|nr:flagellar biosynthesis protein FlgN [Treponema sp.]
MAVSVREETAGGLNPAGISPGELAQRVAVLKRFKALLQEQRDRFHSYLAALDKQQGVIESGSAGDLLAHVELEEKIVADIFSIQKVIDPLDGLYQSLVSGSAPVPGSAYSETAGNDGNVSGLKVALEDLKKEAASRSSRNRELLSRRMTELRTEIQSLRSNPLAAHVRRSAYSGAITASLIDIKG